MKRITQALATYTALQLGLCLLLVVVAQGLSGPRPFDDAYITFRYARNISQGVGFVYNPGERVLGTTTPLYTLLLAGIARLTGAEALPVVSFLLAILFDTLNGWLLFHLAAGLLKNPAQGALIALVFLLHPLRREIAVGGMETPLFILCLLGMYERYLLGKRAPAAALWAGIAFLVRPDALLAVFPVFLDWLIRDRRGFLKAALVFAEVCLPWLVWATLYFGNPIPHSILAKGGAAQTAPAQALYFLLTFFATGTVGPYATVPFFLLGFPAIVLLVYLAWRWFLPTTPESWVIVVYPLIYFLVMAGINPPLHFAWYYPPLMPALLILVFGSIGPATREMARRRLFVAGLVAAFLLLMSSALMNGFPNWPLDRNREAGFWAACSASDPIIQPGQEVLAPDIGILGWCLDQATIFDAVGLVTPKALDYGQEINRDLLAQEAPDYIISLDQFIPTSLRTDPFFQQNYLVIFEHTVIITGSGQLLRVYKPNANLR